VALSIPIEVRSQAVEAYIRGDLIRDIGERLSISVRSVRTFAEDAGVPSRRKENGSTYRRYELNHEYFDDIEEEQAYWLGFLQGDGHIGEYSIRLGLAVKDIDHVDKFRRAIASTSPIHISTYGGSRMCRLSLGSKQMCGRLTDLGIRSPKTFSSCFPGLLAEDLKRHWIRGLFDADGSTWTGADDSRCFWHLGGYIDVIDGVRRWLMKHADVNDNRIYSPPNNSNGYAVLRYTRDADIRSLHRLLYEESTVWMERKRAKIESYLLQKEARQGVPVNILRP